jgi:hypothetical protein
VTAVIGGSFLGIRAMATMIPFLREGVIPFGDDR